MAEAHDRKQILFQNFLDAGVDKDDAARCLAFCECGKSFAAARFLNTHRKELLKDIHQKQQQLDCLDFLAHKISN